MNDDGYSDILADRIDGETMISLFENLSTLAEALPSIKVHIINISYTCWFKHFNTHAHNEKH